MVKRKREQCACRSRKLLKNTYEDCARHPNNIIQHPVLQAVYPKSYTLRDFILLHLPLSSQAKRRRFTALQLADHPDFLDQTLVGIHKQPSLIVQDARVRELSSFTQTQRSASGSGSFSQWADMNEITGFVIWSLFQKDPLSARRPDHILCYGYQRATTVRPSANKSPELCLPGIISHNVNPNVKTLTEQPWTTVIGLLGKDSERLVLNLLTDCGIFVKLKSGSGNFYQLSGVPVYSIPKATSAPEVCERQRANCPGFNTEKNETSLTPGSIVFVRHRIFYARPSLTFEGRVHLGLKHIHVFNRYNEDQNPQQDLVVMQYVFPRQFGLHNVFTSVVDPKHTTQPFEDYTIRESDISSRASTTRIPKRLRGRPKDLIRKIRRNHKFCSYTQLLRYFCGNHRPPGGIASSITDLDDVSVPDELLGLKTQITHRSSNDQFATPPRSAPCTQSSFLPYETPASRVSAFCQAVLRTLLPADCLGAGHDAARNWQTLLSMVNRFVALRRFETFTLHEAANQLKLRSITWLRPPMHTGSTKISLSDRNKRLQLLHEFVYFLFDSVLIPLIQTNFYVTETGAHRYRLSYFRHDIWRKLSEPSILTMRLNMFRPLNPRQLRHALQSSKIGFSQMRLLPKDSGTRPITNLRRRPVVMVNGLRVLGTSINTQLAPVFTVLKFEHQRDPARVGSALFSIGDVRERLRRFKDHILVATTAVAPKLYFAKVDIRSCFDTIPQDALLKLINKLLSVDEYHIAKHVQIKKPARPGDRGQGQLFSKFVSNAQRSDNIKSFNVNTADQVVGQKRKTVFVGTDFERIMRLRQIQKLLEDHVKHNIVRIGRKHFRQINGIPQGSVLSSLLCSFFYADFERKRLAFLRQDTSLLLRLIDDFLLITTDENQARRFVHGMAEENLEHGISINTEKSLVNFEVSVNGHEVPRTDSSSDFPYCGMKIDTVTLDVSKDRHRKDVRVGNALTVDLHGTTSATFQRRIVSALQIQLQSILLDSTLNSKSRIMTTMFECFVETGMKIHQYLKHMPRSKRPQQRFIISVCQRLLSQAVRVMAKSQSDSNGGISRSQIYWIGTAALAKVLWKKQSEYSWLLHWLEEVQSCTQRSIQAAEGKLPQMVQAGMAPFQDYVY